jgi:arginine:agmatine antiporter
VAKSDASVMFQSLAPIFWAFVGLETGAMVAGVVRDPDRNVPRATLAGIAIAGIVYVISSVLVMGIVPVQELAVSNAPFALVAGRIFGDWAMIAIAAAAALKATGTLGGWMLVTGESGARAAQRGFLPAIFGRLQANGSAAWGLFFVAASMSVIAIITMSPTLGEQFGVIIEMVVLLVVLAYAAAGLSLVIGTPSRRPSTGDRMLGIGALIACGLLIHSSLWPTIGGAIGVALAAWMLYRLAGRPDPRGPQPDRRG